MWVQVIGWIMKSKGAKISGGIVGGGSLISLILFLYQDVNGRIDKIGPEYRTHVELVLRPITTELMYMNKEQKETKEMVKEIRAYLLNNKHNGG